ncbi:mannan-binding protein [Mycolicibacterium brumae]|uniref:Mannan-binding protein n=1 Tax=Mycolicibacterium brumae TaxID=85968 RepID=A0A2G5PD84_9MYCO|nr:mannan-binding family protein [Mycolicibacterium brumae]MCV7191833.1 mannan-binding family protein [Mycolicibacterium brumae]PIB76287.1 mannan-binding protein [Mycolicibacterium brumae]RWA15788.1 hypothetical protein MBRU_09570 [Mycolicibacterium brumae DSM 44177]UWW07139.1 mannan-binding family protein [Mycolicibacterium brumae]
MTVTLTPSASASVESFCGDIGGGWDGAYCRTTAVSPRKAVRDIKLALPGGLIDDPTSGPVLREYLTTLMGNWRNAADKMAVDSFAEENFQIFQHGSALSAVFHETYHSDGPFPANAYRTYTFDMAQGRRLMLADIMKPGLDPLVVLPPMIEPFLIPALAAAPKGPSPTAYPFIPERWTPDKVYSGAYKAWALTPDELIIWMPDYPVARDFPVNYNGNTYQWSMDGGTVQVHVPLGAIASVLRPEYGGV